jgi:tRNA 2-thiouridine synthesizing protein A
MAQQVEMSCVGMKCPRPIIEIAKAARKAPPGSILNVQADDLAFESDVRAWAEHTQADILDLERDGDEVWVSIRLAQ